MGLVEPFIEALDRLTASIPAESAPRAQGGPDPFAIWQDMSERHRGIAKMLESQLNDVKAIGKKMVADFETSAEATKKLPPEIDALIDRLSKRELESKKRLLEPNDTLAFPFPPNAPRADRRRITKIINKTKAVYEKVNRKSLAMLRDIRWDLIALRAKYEDPGNAPVFDNAEDLEVYIQAAISDNTSQG